MSLTEYKAKRNFKKTPEPSGKTGKKKSGLRFVFQKHHASRLHYDLRLEMDGVLKSWAVPKGPSMNPKDKRLAMMVEDHPVEYGKFEGIIPKGNYGAGTVMVWDEGEYHAPDFPLSGKENEKRLLKGLQEGNLKFILHGKKLKGEFVLVRRDRADKNDNHWLLIKKNDDYALPTDVLEKDKSVVSGKNLEEIKSDSPEVWHSPGSKSEPVEIPFNDGVKPVKTRMLHNILPMKATLVNTPFDSSDWIFEIKWDGYRAMAELNYNKVELYSRNLLSFKKHFEVIYKSLQSLGIKAVLDGEIVALTESGHSDFHAIQNYKRMGTGNIVYYVFDILWYDGYDLRALPLIERKNILKQVLPDNPYIRYNDHIEEKGIDFYHLAQHQNLEGIIGKKKDSVYLEGKRSRDWIKVKTQCRQEAVIGGFTAPRRSRKYFGSLLLGVFKNGKLTYIGRSGGGFNELDLHELYHRMLPLVRKTSPFEEKSPKLKDATWVRTSLVCEVKFQEWTKDGLMRQPVFIGLREDKDSTEVKKEVEKPVQKTLAGKSNVKKIKRSFIKEKEYDKDRNNASVIIDKVPLRLTNLKKIFWEEEGYTKEDLMNYYYTIAPWILPYLKDRPQSLRRNPNGYKDNGFFQKDMPAHTPDWVKTQKIWSDSNKADINYMFCQNRATLVYMANLGCIEINPWNSRIQNLDYPDYIIIDLDPRGVTYNDIIEVALAVKEVTDNLKIKSFCKTSGSKGMHIYIPLGAKYDYEQAKNFAHMIASLTHQLLPGITSLLRTPSKRENKVYLDFLQNVAGQTLAAPYCLRPRPGATVSTPLRWDEVKAGLDPAEFNIRTIFPRLQKTGDLFKGVLGKGVDIDSVLAKIEISR